MNHQKTFVLIDPPVRPGKRLSVNVTEVNYLFNAKEKFDVILKACSKLALDILSDEVVDPHQSVDFHYTDDPTIITATFYDAERKPLSYRVLTIKRGKVKRISPLRSIDHRPGVLKLVSAFEPGEGWTVWNPTKILQLLITRLSFTTDVAYSAVDIFINKGKHRKLHLITLEPVRDRSHKELINLKDQVHLILREFDQLPAAWDPVLRKADLGVNPPLNEKIFGRPVARLALYLNELGQITSAGPIEDFNNSSTQTTMNNDQQNQSENQAPTFTTAEDSVAKTVEPVLERHSWKTKTRYSLAYLQRHIAHNSVNEAIVEEEDKETVALFEKYREQFSQATDENTAPLASVQFNLLGLNFHPFDSSEKLVSLSVNVFREPIGKLESPDNSDDVGEVFYNIDLHYNDEGKVNKIVYYPHGEDAPEQPVGLDNVENFVDTLIDEEVQVTKPHQCGDNCSVHNHVPDVLETPAQTTTSTEGQEVQWINTKIQQLYQNSSANQTYWSIVEELKEKGIAIKTDFNGVVSWFDVNRDAQGKVKGWTAVSPVLKTAETEVTVQQPNALEKTDDSARIKSKVQSLYTSSEPGKIQDELFMNNVLVRRTNKGYEWTFFGSGIDPHYFDWHFVEAVEVSESVKTPSGDGDKPSPFPQTTIANVANQLVRDTFKPKGESRSEDEIWFRNKIAELAEVLKDPIDHTTDIATYDSICAELYEKGAFPTAMLGNYAVVWAYKGIQGGAKHPGPAFIKSEQIRADVPEEFHQESKRDDLSWFQNQLTALQSVRFNYPVNVELYTKTTFELLDGGARPVTEFTGKESSVYFAVNWKYKKWVGFVSKDGIAITSNGEPSQKVPETSNHVSADDVNYKPGPIFDLRKVVNIDGLRFIKTHQAIKDLGFAIPKGDKKADLIDQIVYRFSSNLDRSHWLELLVSFEKGYNKDEIAVVMYNHNPRALSTGEETSSRLRSVKSSVNQITLTEVDRFYLDLDEQGWITN